MAGLVALVAYRVLRRRWPRPWWYAAGVGLGLAGLATVGLLGIGVDGLLSAGSGGRGQPFSRAAAAAVAAAWFARRLRSRTRGQRSPVADPGVPTVGA